MEATPCNIIKASPLAKKLAKDNGIDLSLVKGNVPAGRIEKADVLDFIAAKTATANIECEPILQKDVEEQKITRIPFIGIRKTTAQRLQRSKENVVPVTSTTEVDITELIELHKKIKAAWNAHYGISITLNAFFLRAVSIALRENLILNSVLEEDNIAINKNIHINLAMNVDGQLFAPVIRNTDTLSLKDIAESITYFVEKAKNGQLTIEDMSEGTFSVTNVGPFDVQVTSPVINYPQVGILAIGKANKRPMFDENDQIVARYLCFLSLTYDHRVIDGIPAAMFRKRINELLANPYLLL